MASEKYTTLGHSTPTASIGSGATSFTVTSASSFPTTPQFRLRLTEGAVFELVLVTGVAGAVFTITRGIEGTTAQNFTTAASVDEVLTAGALDQIRADINAYGPYASLPVSGMKTGDRYTCSDSVYSFLYTGAAWQAFFRNQPVTIPPSGGWTFYNQQSSTVTFNNGLLNLNRSTVTSITVLGQSLGGLTSYTLEAGLMTQCREVNFNSAGVGLYNTANSKLVHWCQAANASGNTSPTQNINKWNAFAFDSQYATQVICTNPAEVWFKIVVNGSTRSYYYAHSRFDWRLYLSTAALDFNGQEDTVSINLEFSNSVTGTANISCFHWSVT